MIRKFTMSFLFLFSLFTVPCFSQESSRYIVDKNSPSIYVKFVRTGEYVGFDKEKIPIVWFRLYNNTKFKLALKANGGVEENDVGLFYETLNDKNEVIESKYCHVCSLIRISGGKSVLFRIPLDYLKGSNWIRIKFNYEWEIIDRLDGANDPIHYVYFETPQSLTQQK